MLAACSLASAGPCWCCACTLQVVFALGPEQRLPAIPAKIQARVVTLDEARRLGENQPKPHIPPSPQDVACLYYTSGEFFVFGISVAPFQPVVK